MGLWSARCVARAYEAHQEAVRKQPEQVGVIRTPLKQRITAGTPPRSSLVYSYWDSLETLGGHSDGGTPQGIGGARGVASCTHLVLKFSEE